MPNLTVAWIDSDCMRVAEQVHAHLHGVEVHFAADLQQIAEVLGSIGEGVIFIKWPLKGVIPGDLITLVNSLAPRNPILLQDLTEDRGILVEPVWKSPAHYVFGAAPLQTITGMLRALGDASFKSQLGNMAAAIDREQTREPWRDMLIGESPEMMKVIDQIRLIAPRRATVLITGETGTGKEVVARAIHQASGRGHHPLVAFNCGALPEALLEAELFGHCKGAFTGAVGQRIGRFEQANKGTIFLDEIGDLPVDLQSKLLRVLQEREFQRLGGSETIKVDVRVIAATNIDLSEAVAKKRFREDLFYRLNVIRLHLPPLRRRTGDISLLLNYFLEKLCLREGLPRRTVSRRVIEHLNMCSWPGNVRQFEHAIETAIILSADRKVLEPSDFPIQDQRERDLTVNYPQVPEEGLSFEDLMRRIERYVLTQALERSRGNKSRAAELLRMKRSTLVSKVKALSDDEPELDSWETAFGLH